MLQEKVALLLNNTFASGKQDLGIWVFNWWENLEELGELEKCGAGSGKISAWPLTR